MFIIIAPHLFHNGVCLGHSSYPSIVSALVIASDFHLPWFFSEQQGETAKRRTWKLRTYAWWFKVPFLGWWFVALSKVQWPPTTGWKGHFWITWCIYIYSIGSHGNIFYLHGWLILMETLVNMSFPRILWDMKNILNLRHLGTFSLKCSWKPILLLFLLVLFSSFLELSISVRLLGCCRC